LVLFLLRIHDRSMNTATKSRAGCANTVGIIGAALIATTIAWLQGAFDFVLHEIVPLGTAAFCALRENLGYYWPFKARPAGSNRFTILIATIDRDDPSAPILAPSPGRS
jgi:hypothetical protein